MIGRDGFDARVCHPPGVLFDIAGSLALLAFLAGVAVFAVSAWLAWHRRARVPSFVWWVSWIFTIGGGVLAVMIFGMTC